MRRAFRILAATLLSLAFSVGLLEICLRVAPQAIPLDLLELYSPPLRGDIAQRRSLPTAADTVVLPRDDGGPPATLWVYKPFAAITLDFAEPGIVKTMQMDDHGFCNPRAGDESGATRLDVAALGDSFTWCTNVAPADTWPSQLAQLTGLRTYDFGLPHRGLYEHLQVLTQLALPRAPAFVVLSVYEGNDLRDAVAFHEWRAADASTRAASACPFRSPAACGLHRAFAGSALGRHSYACNLAVAALSRMAFARQKDTINFQYRVRLADGRELDLNSRNGDRDEVIFAQRLQAGQVRLSAFDEALRRFAELARAHAFVPIVTYTPSAYTAYATRTRFADARIEQLLRTYSERQRRYFAEQARALGLHFVDMTPRLAAAADAPGADLLYFRSNVHLTPAGHAVIARELAGVITKLHRRH